MKLIENSQLVLNVMADLVRDDVSLREIARRSEARFQLMEELKVDVNLLIFGAVERPRRRRSKPAPRLAPAREEHQHRLAVFLFELSAEHIIPHVFSVGEDDFCELRLLIFGGAGLSPRRRAAA